MASISKKRRANRAAGAIARNARREAGSSRSSGLEVEASVPAVQEVARGISSDIFRRRLETALTRFFRKNVLNTRVQGFSVARAVIFNEIKKPHSPFSWEGNDGRKLFTDAERRKVSIEISKEYWEELVKYFSNTAKFNQVDFLSTGELPRTFNRNARGVRRGNPNVAFDHTKRTVFYGSKGDTFKSFTRHLNIIRDNIIDSKPDSSNLKAFIKPNNEWLTLRARIRRKAIDRARDAGLSRARAEAIAARKVEIARAKYKGILNKLDYEGLQHGHTFGAGAAQTSYLLEDPHDLAHKYDEDNIVTIRGIQGTPSEQDLITAFKNIIKADTNLKYEKKYSGDIVGGEVVLLVPEDAYGNLRSGGSIGSDVDKIVNALTEVLNDLPNVEGSLSFQQLIIDILIGSFLGEKPKSGKTRFSSKITTQTKAEVKIYGAKTFNGNAIYNTPKSKGKTEPLNTDLNSLIGFLNARLHDKIRENMGKGGAKQILNYRTGRFAKSAKIQSLYNINEKNAIGAKVKYMRYPYGVFEPKGSLYKPGRDPHGIFGRSIRQLLQEEKIANLRRVKVQLDG